MSNDPIIEQLMDVLQNLDSARNEAQNEHQKLNVALTGALRLLLEDNKTTLTTLHGSPEDLVGYLLKKVDENHRKTLEFHDTLKSKIDNIIKTARNP